MRETVGSLAMADAPDAIEATAPAPDAGSVVRLIVPYIAIARPDHWCKNAFMALGVLLACFYEPAVLCLASIPQVVWAVLATCVLASSNYVLNETLDAARDRYHPVKRCRPIAAGHVLVAVAYAEWLVLGAIGLGLAAAVNLPFLAAGISLLVMGVLYNVPPIRLKDWAYVDVLSESINNPIRLLLGWFALNDGAVPPVSLLIAYWMLGAFFMAAKRFAEYRSIGDPRTAGAYRSSFRHYDEQSLLISMFFYTITFSLFLGVFIIRYHVELILSFPLVAGFLCLYLRLAFRRNSAAQQPERLYREKALIGWLAAGVVVFVTLMFTHIQPLYTWLNVPPSGVTPLWQLGTRNSSAATANAP